jgi:hypothetical protein
MRGATVDLGLSWSAIGAAPGTRVSVVVRLSRGTLVLGRYPAEGTLELSVPTDDFEADHWSV